METADFKTTFSVSKMPDQVFNAITNVRGWWSENIEGGTTALNDVFTYRVKDIHQCTMKLIEVVKDKKIVWLCLDNDFNFTQDKKEWIGTKIEFELLEIEGETQVNFTHWGLVPDYECYNVCDEGWSNYINNSLQTLILTGKGNPNPVE